MFARIFQNNKVILFLCFLSTSLMANNSHRILTVNHESKKSVELINQDLDFQELKNAEIDSFDFAFNQNEFKNVVQDYNLNSYKSLNDIHIELNLPGNSRQVELIVHNVQEYEKGIYTIDGIVQDDPHSFFALTNIDGSLIGKILYDTFTYVVKTVEINDKVVQRIIKIDPLLISRSNDLDYSESIERNLEIKTLKIQDAKLSSNKSTSNVRILFLHANDVYQPKATAFTMISEFNQALSLSGVSGKIVSSAGVVAMDTTFQGLCKDTLFYRMAGENYEFDDIEQWRTNANADIVFLMINGGTCSGSNNSAFGRVGGIARNPLYFNGTAGYPNYGANDAYSVTVDSFILSDNTGIHEVGHILGGFHPSDLLYENARRGKVYPDNNWQSLMGSYDTDYPSASNNCNYLGPNSKCVRINRFTNPNHTYQGVPLGSATEDMANWLNTAMSIAANYKNYTPPAPTVAPSNLSTQSMNWCGYHTLTWNGNHSDALSYQVQHSSSPTFSSFAIIHEGVTDDKNFNAKVPSGTYYYRVRACNAGGCGPYSNVVSAQWSSCI